MPRAGLGRMRLLTVVVGLLTLGATACGGSGAQWQPPGVGVQNPGDGAPAPGAPALTVSLAADATNVSPGEPITVSMANGTLESVVLTNPDNKVVKGDLDEAKTTWKLGEQLGYNKKYTFKIVAVGSDGSRKEDTRSFTTVKPKNLTLPYLRANPGQLLDGGKFGTGQPIVAWFDEPITDRAAAERSLTVTTSPVVEGAWRWMDNHELHWRPKEKWPKDTTVTVEAKVYGKDLGGGLYGQDDVTAKFTIARDLLLVADHDTKHMKLYIDGTQINNIAGKDITNGIPISMGKGGTEKGSNGQIIDFRTNSGPHVVMMKYANYRMTSASFGITNPASPNYYDTNIPLAMRISGDGEFVHKRDWNVSQMGKLNTSHGCVNVGEPYIRWLYDNMLPGDIVDVKNTGKNLDLRNGLGDWMLSWDEWKKGSALS